MSWASLRLPQQGRGIEQLPWHRGRRATHSSRYPQAAMGQCDIKSSTAGTQLRRQIHLSRAHSSHTMAHQVWDKGMVGHPGTVRCSWDTGMRLSRSETALSRARSLVRQRQAGQCFLPLCACPVGLGTWGQWAQTGLSSQGTRQPSSRTTMLAASAHLSLSSSRRPSCMWRWPLR